MFRLERYCLVLLAKTDLVSGRFWQIYICENNLKADLFKLITCRLLRETMSANYYLPHQCLKIFQADKYRGKSPLPSPTS